MSDFDDLNKIIDSSDSKDISKKGELITLDTGFKKGGLVEQVTISSEQKRAQKKAERIHFDAELKKLGNTLNYETEKHRVHQEELTKQKIEEIKGTYQPKIDRLYRLRQDSKGLFYNEAVEKADEEINKIGLSSLRPEMKSRLISKIMDTLDQTLESLGN